MVWLSEALGNIPNDPVITENGLIGWVSDVELTTCRVRTILSPDTKASAIDKKTSDNGIISGNAEYCDDNLTCLTKIAENNKIKVGDIVVTSGTGGVYPKNLIIGKVKELKFNSYDTTRYAVVEPYEDIRTVTSAAIITDFDVDFELNTELRIDIFHSLYQHFADYFGVLARTFNHDTVMDLQNLVAEQGIFVCRCRFAV